MRFLPSGAGERQERPPPLAGYQPTPPWAPRATAPVKQRRRERQPAPHVLEGVEPNHPHAAHRPRRDLPDLALPQGELPGGGLEPLDRPGVILELGLEASAGRTARSSHLAALAQGRRYQQKERNQHERQRQENQERECRDGELHGLWGSDLVRSCGEVYDEASPSLKGCEPDPDILPPLCSGLNL